jgi:hypothetical protein
MNPSSDTTRASLPMQMPHPSLLLLFTLIVWNNASSYIPLAIYYIAQGQTLLRKMCVGGSESIQAKLCSFIYFFSAATLLSNPTCFWYPQPSKTWNLEKVFETATNQPPKTLSKTGTFFRHCQVT